MKTHCMTNTPTYLIWKSMRKRCLHKYEQSYKKYGAKGVTICKRWLDSFLAFLADMGERPSGMTIDRIKVTCGYWCGKIECEDCGAAGREPNCRWATQKEQQRNRSDNRVLEYNGRSQCVSAWAEEIGVRDMLIIKRLNRGWSVEDALTTPILPSGSRLTKRGGPKTRKQA